ncbi:MAG: FAD-linked oxidase C-terminal domain-containing protein [Bacteroidales bacterium]
MDFTKLQSSIKGDLFTDDLHRVLYATDGSAYREMPVAVTRPANSEDIGAIISFARENGVPVIPRGAGTSLAGQVVGSGIVIDVSRYLTNILELNTKEKWVKVEPGVVLAELNLYLAPHGLMFGPETSTANRCVLGGMLGNNSCGLHSIVYGSVRDHILEADAILSDGSEVTFRELDASGFNEKCQGDPDKLETRIYRQLRDILSDKDNRLKIEDGYPDKRLKRRNNGYALDALMNTDPFTGNDEKINMCKLLAGSEGTLAFTTGLKLNLIDIPEKTTGLVCAHFATLQDALKANIIALQYKPVSIELIDDFILNCTKDNPLQNRNRFFIEGDPAAVLLIEFMEDNTSSINEKATEMETALRKAGLGYSFPLFIDPVQIKKVWELRKAGLGVLLNIPGNKRSVQVIEDTAVYPDLYPDYIAEFTTLLEKHDLKCSYYGHIATGELHLSPLLDLKDSRDIEKYYSIAKSIAHLVKKYKGSLSGEHGDGRLRGEFIPLMLGDHVYSLLKDIKKTWDPQNLFNPGKIIDTPSIISCLRYPVDERFPELPTTFQFPERDGILYAVEKCSGSGDCRKSAIIGGTMCPTFMATKDEDKSTRGRANILREFLTRSAKKNRFDHEEIYQVMDLCISCKACRTECPSNVDMARFKAEFLSNYYKTHGIPFRTLLIGWLPVLYKVGMLFRPLTNYLTSTKYFRKLIGFSTERNIPTLSPVTLVKWMKRHGAADNSETRRKVYLFADEFINYNESDIGMKAILLLEKLGYQPVIPKSDISARTFLSKGMLSQSKKVAERNVRMLSGIISSESPLLGLEPSAILSFRDEYPELVNDSLKAEANELSRHAMLFEEFIAREYENGNISRSAFTTNEKEILLHGHCQQKAVSSTESTMKMLSLPVNYKVREIPSGCCGMAGAFGYEKEHHEMSMKIGELVLFPAVRDSGSDTIICAPGTSCRHHIFDGTGKHSLHPVEVLYDALEK